MPTAARRPTLLALFRRANGSMVAELIARLEAAGYGDISAAQHLVFENLDPDGTRLTVLAGRAGLTRQAMTELVEGLRDRGYVELRVDPTDARARLACLTER
ncbi:MAG TPA: helix-turn-helix domain-containing protein, partial [Nocardioides sp.]|nr:helix-turn-helix domain-containing protein [Nocardioides sp.]